MTGRIPYVPGDDAINAAIARGDYEVAGATEKYLTVTVAPGDAYELHRDEGEWEWRSTAETTEACVQLAPGESVILTGLHDGTVRLESLTAAATVHRAAAAIQVYAQDSSLLAAKWALSAASNAGASLPVTRFEDP